MAEVDAVEVADRHRPAAALRRRCLVPVQPRQRHSRLRRSRATLPLILWIAPNRAPMRQQGNVGSATGWLIRQAGGTLPLACPNCRHPRRASIRPAGSYPMNRLRGCDDARQSLAPDRRSFLSRRARRRRPKSRQPASPGSPGHPASASEAQEQRHHPVDARRAEPHRHVGPQARRPGRVSAASSASARRTCPASCSTDMLPMCGQIMDKWSIVRSLHHHDAGHSTGDQICFTGYPAGPEPRRERLPELRLDRRRKQLGHLNAAAAGLRDDPAHGARHRPGLPRRGPQAVRDAGRPGQPRPVPRAELRPAAGRDARAARRPPAAARAASTRCAATWTRTGQLDALDRFQQQGVGHPDLAGGPRRLRPRPRAGRRSASATASCRRSTPRRPTAAAARPGASASCWPAGWSRRACGW